MSKYTFSLTPQVKGYIEWQLSHYKEDKRLLEQYKNDLIPSTTRGYSLTAVAQSGGTSNPTETIAMKLATNRYIRATEQSIRDIEAAISKCDETDMKLIDLVYWRRSYTVAGAGMRVGLGKTQAYKRINNILCRIALEMGVVNI